MISFFFLFFSIFVQNITKPLVPLCLLLFTVSFLAAMKYTFLWGPMIVKLYIHIYIYSLLVLLLHYLKLINIYIV